MIPAAALGAFVGDNSYGLGAVFGERVAKRLFSGEKGRRRLRKAQPARPVRRDRDRRTFREDIWKALALGFGIALAVTAAIELVRRGRAGAA